MPEMNRSSEETAVIARIIEEIAFHTSIVALSAALATAMPGEHGASPSSSPNGCAAADEAPNVSQSSAQAAKDTTLLMEEVMTRSGVLRTAGSPCRMERGQMQQSLQHDTAEGELAWEDRASRSLLALAGRLRNPSGASSFENFAPETAWPPQSERASTPVGVFALMPGRAAFPHEDETAN